MHEDCFKFGVINSQRDKQNMVTDLVKNEQSSIKVNWKSQLKWQYG